MTSPARSSLQLPFLYPPRCFMISRRTFAAASSRAASSGRLGSMSSAKFNRRSPAQRSIKVVMREMMKKEGITNDLGLLPETFIMPTGSNRPSLVSMPRARLRLEWHRLKKRVMDLVSVMVYRPKPRTKLVFGNKAKTAQALHAQMYSAFAEGDIETLKSICADGLLKNFEGRIAQRLKSEKHIWTLHKYNSSPKVVSHRAAPLPEVEGVGIRQAIVKIRSKQSLNTVSHNAAAIEPRSQDKQEYVVIQKRMHDNKEGPWLVWGTVDEPDWENIVS